MQNFMIYLAIVGIMLQAGCGAIFPKESTPPFGSSVRMAVASQTANPEAGSDALVVGLDGKYAAAAAEKHQAGPKEKSERNFGSIFGVVEDK
ncbi:MULTISPECIES: hypothetical protein [unclassified Pseudodesulfovibrio]|uniref:hypothetical protein n=1 Tax=unclassified Pseudodesulfovibrio TaxID=2661612 RepID=UPI000FEBD7BA|nr:MULTISPECIES: hypothetical protein [unclassified Pseudodesulfovibrio]MCJ2164426.1 hypothetical protein [Pseudodesulfovibrio sp. S3-i]RWU04632.1 hypothetical protein DWB63_07710 [Pseudodesulfovibrio sp. S3]